MNKIKRTIFSIILAVVLLGLAACNLFHPPLPPSTAENLPPETHISFFYHPDTTLGPGDYWVNKGDTTWVLDTLIMGLDTTVSVQEVNWWGDDPDGNVIGYYYRWSYMDSAIFTQDESALFYLPLRTQFDIYSFHVQAVDNDSLMDPTAAIASFPVFNSPPEVEWKLNSLPISTREKDSVHYSFTHHSFYWDISDIDGEETITEIYYALDDTSSWTKLDGTVRDVMLTDITPGKHNIYLKVKDIAGAKSNVITFPDRNSDESEILVWEVVEPIGDILIVNDFAGDQVEYTHQNLFTGIFDGVLGSNSYSVWGIGSNIVNTANTIPYSPIDIEFNLSSFSKVFWFTFQGSNNLNDASLALTRFIADGGTLLMNNAQKVAPESRPDTIWTFTDIDTVYQYSSTGRIWPGINIEGNWGDTTLNNKLELQVEYTMADKLYAVVPGSSSTLRYHFAHDSLDTGTGRLKSDYTGTPPVMIETPIGDGLCYYMSIPLYFLNGNGNLDELFKHVFELDE
ncbi:MAG: hypothetical protein KAU44_00595 [Candidatus Marinimicrobia bacterium]|nr:hypothetical protein [Candidatus Neomarinimicrobiota bacterium]